MGATPKRDLHAQILMAVGSEVMESGPLNGVPYRLRLNRLGDFAFYAFTLTSPPGGRPIGEYKVQLIAPKQSRGERGTLEYPSGAFTIVAGWSQEEEVFALWDAYAHPSFSYSQNLQVKGENVWSAQVRGLSTCERRLRLEGGVEKIVVCSRDHLLEAIHHRVQLSACRLGELGRNA